MKTNDPETIKNDTKNFEPGKVFRGNGNDLREVTPYSGEELYDTKTKNFHICPADEKDWKPISEEYSDMRVKLKAAFEKYFNEIKEGNKVVPDDYPRTLKALQNDPEYCSDTIYSTFGSRPDYGIGSRGVRGTPLSVYRFLAVIYKGAWYRINFMRMYHDGKYVHCHMNELQYDKDISDNGYGLNKDEDGSFAICYPPSCHDGDIGKNNAGYVVKNPDDVCYSDIENDPEKVVTSFLSFVAENSKDENVPV